MAGDVEHPSVPGLPVGRRNGRDTAGLGKMRAQCLSLIAAFFCHYGLKALARVVAFFKSEH